jgi:16S rRNA (adenine1518-N6/adenine1519-N6)-dimethyltransferase
MATDETLMFNIIRASFNQRRKTLQNGLKNSGLFPLSKDEIVESIIETGLPETVRGEALTLEQFAQLANIMYHKIHK